MDQPQPRQQPQQSPGPNQAETDPTDMSALPDQHMTTMSNMLDPAQASLLQQMNPEAMAALQNTFVPESSLDGGLTMPNAPSYLDELPKLPPVLVDSDDVARYDRQIRLWGMAAQTKIQNASILLITLRGLGNEIAKNLVLGGIGSITLLDGATVTEADLGCQFLVFEAGGENVVGQNRAHAASHGLRKLNPRVHVHVDADDVTTKSPSYFGSFDMVIATDLGPDAFNLINTATRLNSKPFYAAGSHGMYGFIFSDLIEHDFIIERQAGNVPTKPNTRESRTRVVVDVTTHTRDHKTIETVIKRELYSTWYLASDVAVLPSHYTDSRRRLRSVTPALSCLRALWDFNQSQAGRQPTSRDDLKLFTQIATKKHKMLKLPPESLRPEFLRSFLQNLGSEIAPVVAVLGGHLAQDVLAVLGQIHQPIQNTVIFDGSSMQALMYSLHPELPLGAGLLTLTNDPVAAAAACMPPVSSGSMLINPTAAAAGDFGAQQLQ